LLTIIVSIVVLCGYSYGCNVQKCSQRGCLASMGWGIGACSCASCVRCCSRECSMFDYVICVIYSIRFLDLAVMKTALMSLRSVVLSVLCGKTIFPMCRSILPWFSSLKKLIVAVPNTHACWVLPLDEQSWHVIMVFMRAKNIVHW
jgi:hypothetical protein